MTREEWAISRTTVYAGMDNPKPASTGLSEYAGAEEIDAAIASLRQSYTDYGRLLKKHPDDNLQRSRRRGINTIIKSMREENRVPHGVYLYHAFGADPLPAPLDAIVRRSSSPNRRPMRHGSVMSRLLPLMMRHGKMS